jgi:hypothetical protein
MDYIFRFELHNKLYQTSFLGQKGAFFFSFYSFSKDKKKEGHDTLINLMALLHLMKRNAWREVNIWL